MVWGPGYSTESPTAVDRKMISTALPHKVDASVSVSGIDVEVQTYHQPTHFEGVFEIDAHILSMSLTPQVGYSKCCYLGADGQPGPWVQAGDIIFTPRGTRLMLVSPGGAESYRGIYCSFASPLFEQVTGLYGDWSVEQLLATLNVRAPQIKRDLYRIVKEISESEFARDSLIESAARIVLVELARFLRQATQPAQPARASLAAWQLRRITDYVEGMIDHSPTVDELARLCEIGPRQLARAFKATTGRTIGDYVTEVRMTKAKSLLADTELSQKEIAYRLGFSGPSSFCVAFGKTVGMTPKQFRVSHYK